MTTMAKPPTNKTQGGIRRRGERGTWTYTIDLGLQPAQRCPACKAAGSKPARWWVGRKPLPECPACGGKLTDTRERREESHGGFRTERLAKTARDNARSDLGKGTHVARDRITLGTWLTDEWLPSLEIGKLRPSTRISYATHVRHHLAPTKLGLVPLQELSRERIAAHYAWLLADGRANNGRDSDGSLLPLSASTVRRVHATLHRALRDAVRSHLIPINPSSDIELPAVDDAKQHLMAWDSAELRTFLTSVKGDRLSALWLTYATTGARRGELLGLTWDDIDIEAGRLKIMRARVEVGREVIENGPKTKSGRRTIELDLATVAALKSHGTRQKEERLAAGPRWQESGHVFVDELGQPLHPGAVSRTFKALVKQTELPGITLHGMRHTYITVALLELGLPTTMVSKRVGHANEAITLMMYAEWLPRHDQEAAAAVAGLVVPQGF